MPGFPTLGLGEGVAVMVDTSAHHSACGTACGIMKCLVDECMRCCWCGRGPGAEVPFRGSFKGGQR